MVYRAIDALCQYWIQETEKIQEAEKLDVRGYLEVKNTRVIYLCDPLPEGELYEKAFGDTVCIVEFMLLTDFYGSAPVFRNFGVNDTVAVKKDGTYEVCGANPFMRFAAATYQYDFSGIVASISDRGDDFNGRYIDPDTARFPSRRAVEGGNPRPSVRISGD